MGMFDADPKYQQLKRLRESGYSGWVDHNNKKVKDVDRWIKKNTKRK